MTIFALPDLGEGLQEAELVSWHVSENDHVVEDQPLPGPGRAMVHRRLGYWGPHAQRRGAPRGRKIPRLRQLTVTFGEPAPLTSLSGAGNGPTEEERVAARLRQRLAALMEAPAKEPRLVADFERPIDGMRC